MADDYQDLGSNTVLFDFEPNWVSNISAEYELIRHLVRYPGGASYMTDRNEFTPMSWSAQYNFYTKEEESDFLTFLYARNGNVGRFWAIYPKTLFVLKQSWSSGDVICEPNHYHLWARGVERFFMILSNGDTLTRKISSVVYDDVADTMTMSVSPSPPATIAPADVVMFGFLYLVRFDSTRYKITSPCDVIGSISLNFYELDEYEDSDL